MELAQQRSSVLTTTERAAYEQLPSDEEATHPSFNPIEYTATDFHETYSLWSFVETGWFQAVTALVIVMNFILMMVEDNNSVSKDSMWLLEYIILSFYIFETSSRAFLLQRYFFCGPITSTVWNILDVLVVVAGVLEQWLLPNAQIPASSSLSVVLSALAYLRVARALKIIKIACESDLSWTESGPFESFICFIIMLNAILMGMETDIEWEGWVLIEQVLLSIYVFELFVRLKRHKFDFFSLDNPDIWWNLLDFLIVVSSTFDSWIIPLVFRMTAKSTESGHAGMGVGKLMMLMRLLRLMRILRLVRLVKAVRPLFVLVTGIYAACQSVFWVVVLTFVILYGMGIMTTHLIGKGMVLGTSQSVKELELPFETVPESMFTLFLVMSGAASEVQLSAISHIAAESPSIKFLLIFFMITSSWTLLSILTAVVSDHMITNTSQQDLDMKLALDDEEHEQQKKGLEDLFQVIDDGEGVIHFEEFLRFLEVKENASRCAKSCQVPVRYIKALFHDLSGGNQRAVDMDEFIERLIDVGQPVKETSVMRLESCIHEIHRRTGQLLQASEANMGARSTTHLPSPISCELQSQIADAVNRRTNTSHDVEGIANGTPSTSTEGHFDSMSQLILERFQHVDLAIADLNSKLQHMSKMVTKDLLPGACLHQPQFAGARNMEGAERTIDALQDSASSFGCIHTDPGSRGQSLQVLTKRVAQGLAQPRQQVISQRAVSGQAHQEIIRSEPEIAEALQSQLQHTLQTVMLDLITKISAHTVDHRAHSNVNIQATLEQPCCSGMRTDMSFKRDADASVASAEVGQTLQPVVDVVGSNIEAPAPF